METNKIARHGLVLAVLLLLGGLSACGQLLSVQEVEAHGSHVYKATPDKVMAATVKTLQSEGYDIAVADDAKGLIRTSRKVMGSQAVATGRYSAVSIPVTRQYTFTLRKEGEDGTRVVAQPRIFRGETDLSTQKVWVLEGAGGERALWSRLFQQIGEML